MAKVFQKSFRKLSSPALKQIMKTSAFKVERKMAYGILIERRKN